MDPIAEVDKKDTNEEWLCKSSNSKCKMFDTTIGHIEEIIMEPDFQKLQNDFLEKYYVCFEDKEENKLEYMDIFREYTDLIESYIETELNKRIPDFNMAQFLKQMQASKNDLDGEVFDILFSFTDFLVFKEMVLDYKAAKQRSMTDFSMSLLITSLTENLKTKDNNS
ncbi:ADP-ribosylation factor-like protein 2-binding protein isoform X2 [Centruroides sculpturatus]|uniref:ADP-ribosylation factor-like protein 2-binding protein isoform X2 n=1 Tax=Centruroides sculpturatus TaxID=218467 RepID=UPI000C6CFB4E|nr:ADP-ribosylation factor-like protein 2-binding protein isoform X2 [Centruroides sculpturatus]